jgi:hypothetical protein
VELLIVLVFLAVIWAFLGARSARAVNRAGYDTYDGVDTGYGPGQPYGAPARSRRPRPVTEADLDAARRAAEEDVTRFGEELQRLDSDVSMRDVDEAMRQDWQRALDSYDAANRAMGLVQHPDDLRHVTSALEDGRYAIACVRARREGKPLPQRRPPCFFNPSHGPSVVDVEWAPPGGQPRQVPVCGADQDRLAQGAEPDVRTVPQGAGRVPYWSAGPAYSPWAMGYFGGYAMTGLLPGFMLGTLLASDWDGTPADGFDTGEYGDGYAEGDAGDGYDDAGGDGGGYDDAGGDGGGYDDAGYDGGSDAGGGFGDFGGGDFGGGGFGDFGGGDFGGGGDF